MARWIRVLVLAAIGIGVFAILGEVFMGHMNRVDAKALEREVRVGLPAGCSISAVEDFLNKRGISNSLDPTSKTVYAIVRNTKGSTAIFEESLTFQFHFDDSSRLTSIDAKAVYTGP